MSHPDTSIEVVGAGPARLAAAITLARSGRRVVVHEARPGVGRRFDGDLQGLENWTTTTDVIDEFRKLGITSDFARMASTRLRETAADTPASAKTPAATTSDAIPSGVDVGGMPSRPWPHRRRCLRLSSKHASPTRAAADPRNARRPLRRMRTVAIHPRARAPLNPQPGSEL